MLTKRIIPCLDVADGRVVKGINFVDLVDAGDPVEQASTYDAQGADEICFLDISASPEGRSTIVDVVTATASKVFTPLTVGGGVRKIADIEKLLRAGADKIAINTAAIETPELIDDAAKRFGNQAIVVAVDAKRTGESWDVFSHGGRTSRGIDAIAWCKELADRGAGELLLTSMDRDGTKSGYDIELLNAAGAVVNVPIVASGGVGELAHFKEGFTDGGASACLAASVFHFGKYKIADVKEYLSQQGVVVRI